MQPAPGRRGKSRPQILYWFRTPPKVKVGREPFAEHVRRALEAQNPGVRFDWDALVATPVPPPETDYWRERRQAERAARQMAEAEEEAEPEGTPALDAGAVALEQSGEEAAADTPPPIVADPTPSADAAVPSPGRRRRRRRGGRRRHRPGNEAPPSADKLGGE